MIYTSSILYTLSSDDYYLEKINFFLQESFLILEKERNSDFIDGISGFIICVHNLKQKFNFPLIRPLLMRAIHVLDTLTDDLNKLPNNLGLAHGLSGILYALIVSRIYVGSEDAKNNKKINFLISKMDNIDPILCENTTWCECVPPIVEFEKRTAPKNLIEFF